jgi:hypothetical protein
MRIQAAITDPDVARRILECMRLPARAPPLTPESPPGDADDRWIEDQRTADFDQTPPDDGDTWA